jgi:uncharacterized membrane protein
MAKGIDVVLVVVVVSGVLSHPGSSGIKNNNTATKYKIPFLEVFPEIFISLYAFRSH